MKKIKTTFKDFLISSFLNKEIELITDYSNPKYDKEYITGKVIKIHCFEDKFEGDSFMIDIQTKTKIEQIELTCNTKINILNELDNTI
jgi:hypothetical protein